MNIVSKEEVDKWNDKHKIESMKHTKSLRTIVNPPKPKKLPRIRQPRNHSVSPETMFKGLSYVSNQLSAPPCPYNEYKDSIKKTSASLLSSVDANNQEALKQKILESNDIATICANKLMDFSGIENEWLILCLTIGGKILESKFSV